MAHVSDMSVCDARELTVGEQTQTRFGPARAEEYVVFVRLFVWLPLGGLHVVSGLPAARVLRPPLPLISKWRSSTAQIRESIRTEMQSQ